MKSAIRDPAIIIFTAVKINRKENFSMEITVIEPKKRETLRVAAYCRVSTDKDNQIESLEVQYKSYLSKILSHDEWQFAGIYADMGKSGTETSQRPQFNQLFLDAQKGKMDIILVKSISRFARNIIDCQNYARKLKSLGIELIFEKEKISNMDPSADFIFSILSLTAQEESHNLSQHIKWTINKNYEKGIHRLGNHRVLGYDSVEGELVPNQDSIFIQMAFEAYAEGKTLSQVAELLNLSGAKRLRSKKAFDHSCIKYILQNEIYVGDRFLHKKPPLDFITKKPLSIYNTYYVTNDHTPIISRELWAEVQKRLKQTSKNK